MRILLLLIVLGGLSVLAGCQERPIPVAGTVYIDGQPVQGGHIRVIPAHTRSAQAMIDKQGKFRLFTRTNNDGVYAGEHPIEIVSVERLPGGNRWLIPKKYSDANSSGLTIKVDKATSDLRIDLTWDGGKPFVEAFENTGDAPPVGAIAEPGEELEK